MYVRAGSGSNAFHLCDGYSINCVVKVLSFVSVTLSTCFFLLLLLRCPLGFIFTNNNSTCPPDTPNFVLHHKNKSVNIYFNHK